MKIAYCIHVLCRVLYSYCYKMLVAICSDGCVCDVIVCYNWSVP